MKKRFEGIQILLVIGMALFILALPAYLRCNRVPQTKFVSSDLGFENLGQEEVLPDNERELKLYGPSASSITFHTDTNLLEQCFHPVPQALSLRQRIFALRC